MLLCEGRSVAHIEARSVPEPNSGCWLWLLALDRRGYGKLSRNGLRGNAHRAAHFIATGELPPLVRHRCDNRACVNPDHLVGGTQFDNMADALRRGRRVGRKPARDLTAEELAEARALFRKGCPKFGGRALARRYGVPASVMHRWLTKPERPAPAM